MMRDQLKNQAYYDKWIQHDEEKISEMYAEIKGEPALKGNVGYAFRLFSKQYHVLISKYSRGDGLSNLKPEFLKVLDAWDFAKNQFRSLLPQKEWLQYEGIDPDNYPKYLWLLSFAVHLNLDAALLARTIKLIGNQGRDALLDSVLVKLNTVSTASSDIMLPRPYQALMDVVNGPPDKQAALMAKFLKGWYAGSKKSYWYDNAKREDSGYFGFWCFEAALVVKLWGIDDSLFCEHPHYPKDLARWKG
jgi:hypothetical protein